MKLPNTIPGSTRRDRSREQGVATLIIIILLLIMMILVTAEMRSLAHLGNEVRFLEKQQIKRIATPVSTNLPPPKP